MPTIDDYKNFFTNIRKQTGLDMLVPDEDGLLTFRVDDEYTINLQFIETTGKILCFVEVTTIPSEAGVAVYRDILSGSLFGKETAGGYFALEEESNTIIYNYLFDFDKVVADPEAFVETLENILQLVNVWADRINGNQGNEDSEESTPFVNPAQLSNMFFRP
ncbi:MAG: type III secretion system chaperone [Victivallales bacterium]|nr:type III secretion system chaperone [Victivallales bacterium]